MQTNAHYRATRSAKTHICALTGERLPEAALMRLVYAPNGDLVPDLALRLPGKAIWVSARRDVVARAAQTLSEQIANILDQNLLGRIGMIYGAGKCVTGFDTVMAAIKKGKAALVFCAHDAAENSTNKIKQQAIKHYIPYSDYFTRTKLSDAVARQNLTFLAICDKARARALRDEIKRIMRYNGIS